MRPLRYGPVDGGKPGLFNGEGNLRNLSSVVADIDLSSMSAETAEDL
jgi:hypothetical protein